MVLKKILAAVLLAAMLFTMIACAPAAPKTPEPSPEQEQSLGQSPAQGQAPEQSPGQTLARSVEEIKASGKLILATSADYPPYEFHTKDSGIQGFDIEIGRLIAKELGVELQIDDMDFNGLLMALEAGACDLVLAALTPDEERKKSVDFSESYYHAKQGVVVRKDDLETYKTTADFSGKQICAQLGSIQETIANEQFDGASVITLAKLGSLILELQTERVEAIVMELPVAEMYVAVNPELVVSEVTVVDTVESNAIAVAKGNSALLEVINKVLGTLDEETVNNLARDAAALCKDEL